MTSRHSTLYALLLVSTLTAGAAPREDLPAAAAADLGWIAGHWQSTAGDKVSEELWLAPREGTLMGLHRDAAPGRVSFEFMRIADTDQGTFLYASPGGQPPTPFRLVETAPGRCAFTNPEHDFPQRIEYWLDAAGALHARASDLEGEGQEWVWKRVP